MRRSDREVTDFNDITDILRRADTIRLGLNGGTYPYVVPLSFGLESSDGHISLYFHGAAEGMKHDLIAQDPNVCVEADILHGYAEKNGSITAEYESVIGFGRVTPVLGDEAVRGMALMLEHCRYGGFEYDRAALDRTRIYRIDLISFTGKRRRI